MRKSNSLGVVVPELTTDQYSTIFVLSIAAGTVAHVIGADLLLVVGIALGSFAVGLIVTMVANKRTVDPGE